MRKLILLFLLVFLVSLTVQAQEEPLCVAYFYSKTCSHCASIKPFIEQIEQKFGNDIMVHRLDVGMPMNVSLYNKVCNAANYEKRGVPLVAINDKILIGEDNIKDDLETLIKTELESGITTCMMGSNICTTHNTTANNFDNVLTGVKNLKWYSILPLILFTGLSDGINPCAFAVLLFIMAFLQQISNNKKRLLRITVAYIIAVLVVNIILGIVYYYTSMQIGFPTIIRTIAAGLAIIAGLINIKDFFFYGKGISLKIPSKSKKILESLAQKATVPSAIILGSLVAILEAPCSIPIYLTVLEVLKGQGFTIIRVFPYILLYNMMFIIPIVILAGAIYFGTSASQLEKLRKKNRSWMKLMLGIILIGLAIAMLSGWI